MSLFSYTATARQRGVKDMFVGACLAGVSLGFIYLFVYAESFDIAALVWSVVFAIFLLAGAVFLLGGIARLITGGAWRIDVDQEHVSWQTPLVAEPSFRYAIKDIARIERRIRTKKRKDGSTKRREKFFLCGVDGTAHHLTHQSGIDVEQFLAVLADLGVTCEDVAISR